MGVTWLGKLFSGKLGYKTVIAAALIAVSVIGQATGHLTPEKAEGILRFGEALGLIGLRDAIAKLPK